MNVMTNKPKSAESDEVPFRKGDLFYTRTDKRGVIQSGNTAFQRVSGFEWARLAGAPHRIMRHDDMPRAVFRILWQTIQRQEPVVAYIKNKAEDGRHYWALATLLPYPEGYLSFGIKPTSPLSTTVKREYAALLDEERAEELPPEAAADRLLKRLHGLGFPDYRSFMINALAQEYDARAAQQDRGAGAQKGDVERIRDWLASLIEQQEMLLQEFNRLRDLPTNMRIIASRLEPSGGPVSAISENYKVTSTELARQIQEIAVGDASLLNQMKASFDNAVFQLTCARLQIEAIRNFEAQPVLAAGFDVAAEAQTLAGLGAQYGGAAKVALVEAERISAALNLGCSDIRRSMLGLDSIRVMGRVESGRMGSAGTRLGATIDQLDSRHAAIIERLQTIIELSASINTGVVRIRKGVGGHASVNGPQPNRSAPFDRRSS